MNGLVCAICPTFNRPELLSRAIRSFEKQTYDNRYLIIVDDLGQYENQAGDRWELISIPRRFLTLGEKRNFAAALAPRDTWAYAVWDDDDLYMPWHLEAVAKALSKGLLVQPRHAVDYWNGRWVVVETFNKRRAARPRHPSSNFFCYHGCWGYTRELFKEVGGYRPCYADDDIDFQHRLISMGVKSVGFCAEHPPSYFYNRNHTVRISELGKNEQGYWTTMCDAIASYVGKVPKWLDDSEWDRDIPSEVIQRPW